MREAVSFCGILILVGTALSGIPQPIQMQTPLQHEVNVTLKLIQVYVTDKKGNPVLDLDAKDFAVFDNGVQKNITDFEKHSISLGSRGPSPDTAAERVETTPIPVSQQLSRKILILIDYVYNTNKGFLKAKQAALDFLDNVALPTDEIGIFTYSSIKSLKINEYFSANHRRIRKTLEDLSVNNVTSGSAEDFEKRLQQDTEIMDERGIIQETKNQALNFLNKMTALAKGLRYIPGQKNILLFSSGIPVSLINGSGITSKTFAEKGNFVLHDMGGDKILQYANKDMFEELNSANCRVFTFDTKNADLDLFIKRDDMGITQAPTAVMTNSLNRELITQGAGSLSDISRETGGLYFGNINEYKKRLEQLQSLTGEFYVLGYPIDIKEDGKFRKIKVEIKRKGCEARTQLGYFNPKPFKDYSDLEKQLHLVDLSLSEQPLFQKPSQFPMNALLCPYNDKSNLILISKIPIQIIDKFNKRKIELISLVFDEKDDIVDLQRIETSLDQYKGMDVYMTSTSPISPGNHKARFVVRDLDSGEAAVASATARILPYSPSGLTLFSPLLLIPEGNLVYFEKDYLKRNDQWPLAKAYPYDRAQYSPVMREVPNGTQKVYALLSCSCRGIAEPNLVYSCDCINAVSGEKATLDISIIKKTANDSLDSQLIELPISKLIPGKYYLYFHANDLKAQLVGFSQTQLIIAQ